MAVSKMKICLSAAVLSALLAVSLCGLAGCACSSEKVASDAEKTPVNDIAEPSASEKDDAPREITYTLDDGTTYTVVVSKGESGSGIEVTEESSDGGSSSGSESKPESKPSPSPSEQPDKPDAGDDSDDATDFEQFINMSSEDQYRYFKTFDSPEEFLEWYHAELEAYKKAHPSTSVNPGDMIHF